MSGAITKREVLRHPFLVVRLFGLRVLLRALFGRCPTFLVCCCDLRGER
jgi:hypothetical protein